MSDYPLVGQEPVINNDLGEVSLFGTVFDNIGDFTPLAAQTYPAGTVLARLTADPLVLTPYVPGAATGAEVPVAVLGSAVIAPSTADIPVRVIVGGEVRGPKLTVDTAGSPVALDDVDKDRLRSTGIIPLDTLQLSKLDNQ